MLKIYTFLLTGTFIFLNLNDQKVWASIEVFSEEKSGSSRSKKPNLLNESDDPSSSLSLSDTEIEEKNPLNQEKESNELSEEEFSSQEDEQVAIISPMPTVRRRSSISEAVVGMVTGIKSIIWNPPATFDASQDYTQSDDVPEQQLSKSLSPKNTSDYYLSSKFRSNTSPVPPTTKPPKFSNLSRRRSYPETNIPEYSTDPDSPFQRMNDYMLMGQNLSVQIQNLDKCDIKHILDSPRFQLTEDKKNKFIFNFFKENPASNLEKSIKSKNFHKGYQYITGYSHLIDMADLVHIFSSPKLQLNSMSLHHLRKGLLTLYDQSKFAEAHHPVSVINNGFYCLLERLASIEISPHEIDYEIKQLEARQLNSETSKPTFQDYDGVRQLVAKIESLFKKRQKIMESSNKLGQDCSESTRYSSLHSQLVENIEYLKRTRDQISEMNKTFALHYKRFQDVEPAFAIYIEDFPCGNCRQKTIDAEVKSKTNVYLAQTKSSPSSKSRNSPSLTSIPESRSTENSKNESFQKEMSIFELDAFENEE